MDAFDFKKILEEREQLKKEQEEAKNSTSNNTFTDYEELDFLAMEDAKDKVFRIYGFPFSPTTLERKSEFDTKLILQSQIVKDDLKGYAKINWPVVVDEKTKNYVPDPNWILTRFYNAVNAGKWEKYPDGQVDKKGKNGHWVKFYEGTKVFDRVNNNAKIGEKWPKFFYPSKRIVMNVLDKNDDVCKNKKHSKILTSKMDIYSFTNEQKEQVDIKYIDTGIPLALYNKILDHCRASLGHWNVDLVVTKRSAEKSYDVWDATDAKYLSEYAKSIATEADMTAEEKEYELYDLDKFYGVTSYTKLKKVLGGLFKLGDVEMNTKFTEELNFLVEQEQKEWELNKPKQEEEKQQQTPVAEDKEEAIASPQPEQPKEETVSEESPRRESRQARTRQTSEESISDLCIKNFPHFMDLIEEEKADLVDSIDHFEGTVPVYKEKLSNGSSVDLFTCYEQGCTYVNSEIETEFHSSILTCPVCGASDN